MEISAIVAAVAFAAVSGCTADLHPATIAVSGGHNLAHTPHDGLLPIGAFEPNDARLDQFVRNWYGEQLAAMNEPRLGMWVDSSDVEAIRFLWLRSFHHPVAVRAIRRGMSYSLVAVELTGAGGYEPGTILRRDSLRLDSLTWKALVTPLRRAEFWDPDSSRVGLDGAEWIVEAVTRGQLFAVKQWSPEATGTGADMRAFGLAMLRLTSIPADPVY